MVWQSSTNEDTAFPWWYDEGTPLSRTCFIFGHWMWPTQEPPCRFQTTCFQISRFARFFQSVNFFHLALDMAMVPFQFFSCLFTDPFLSGVIGVFLLVRCIPHQNSQRLFWASVCKAVAWLHHDPNDHVTRPVLSKRSWNLDNVWRRDLIRGVLSFQGTSWWHDRHLVRAKSKFWVATNCKSDRWPTKRFYGGRWMSAGGYTDGVQPRSRMR